MERIPPENKKALAQMNWDERLKEARARRAKIMESRHSGTVEKGQTLFNPPKDDGDEKLDKLRLAARGQLPRETKRAPLAVKSRRAGLIPLVFGIGILLGVGLTQFQFSLPGGAPTPTEDVASDSSAQDATPIEPALVPATSNQVAVDLAAPPLPFDQIGVLPEVDIDVSSVRTGIPHNVLVWPAPSRLKRPGFVVASAIDTVPATGLPPELATSVATAPEESIDIDLLDTVALLNSVNAGDQSADLDILPIAIVTGARSVQELEEYAFSDTVPLSLESLTAPELDRTGNETASLPLTPDAIARPIWIFAPSSVGEDVLDTTQSAAERLNLSVQAVNRVTYRISRSQVRYYDPDSADAAGRLAVQIDAIPRDFTTSDVNAAPGTLEIYLAGRPVVARSQSATAAPRAEPANDLDSLRNSVIDRIRAGLSN
ncbi:MAG: hypothetical protein ACI89J_003854 [Hyphomicrobiaceae bacterium]